MKRIGIISDTHGCFDQTLHDFLSEVDEIWHAGDIGSLELADRIAAFKPLRAAVSGNIDGGMTRRVYPDFLAFRCEEVQVLMTPSAAIPATTIRGRSAASSSCVPNSSSPAIRTSSRCSTTGSTTCSTSIRALPANSGSTACGQPSASRSTATACSTWRWASGRAADLQALRRVFPPRKNHDANGRKNPPAGPGTRQDSVPGCRLRTVRQKSGVHAHFGPNLRIRDEKRLIDNRIGYRRKPDPPGCRIFMHACRDGERPKRPPLPPAYYPLQHGRSSDES